MTPGGCANCHFPGEWRVVIQTEMRLQNVLWHTEIWVPFEKATQILIVRSREISKAARSCFTHTISWLWDFTRSCGFFKRCWWFWWQLLIGTPTTRANNGSSEQMIKERHLGVIMTLSLRLLKTYATLRNFCVSHLVDVDGTAILVPRHLVNVTAAHLKIGQLAGEVTGTWSLNKLQRL